MSVDTDRNVKKKVAEYWDTNPCGSFASDEQPGRRRFYDQVAGYRYAAQPFMREIVGFERYAGQRVLEVGCGLGTDLLQFAQTGATAVGIDLSSQSLSLASEHLRVFNAQANFLQSDAESLPFADAAFDVVYSFGVLHHTPDAQRAIDECYRVLKAGGKLILMLYHRKSWLVQVEPYLVGVKRLLTGRRLPPGFTDPQEVIRRYDGDGNPLGRAYSREEVRGMLLSFVDIRLQVCSPTIPHQSRLVQLYGRVLEGSGINRRWGFWIVAEGSRPIHEQEVPSDD